MTPILSAVHAIYRAISGLLWLGRVLGVVAIAAMVVAILTQVWFRYVLGSALPWPDEAARFCMLWMTGLMAPSALRAGGFVAIDTLESLLPHWPARLLQLALLCVSLMVLLVAIQIGWKEINGIGGRFMTASLYVPTDLSFDSWYRVPRKWMMTSLVVGLGLLILVNIELILHKFLALIGYAHRLPELAPQQRVD